MSEHQDPRPRDDTDAVKDIARDLAEVAAQIATFKGEANAYLGDPNYNALRHRLEVAHAAVEGRSGKLEVPEHLTLPADEPVTYRWEGDPERGSRRSW